MLIATEILRQHKLRTTPNRLAILEVFTDKAAALSESDLEKGLNVSCDRVTIYRTLGTFVEKGILHKVLDDKGVTKYALCSESCEEGDHNHDHVHFKCSNCGKTVCIEGVPVPAFSLPQGFDLEETNVLLQGICDKCS